MLNQQQQQIVQHTQGVHLVVSGPGTGKTTTITHFLTSILNNSMGTPEQVLAVTFTVKAAREMGQRVYDLTGQRPVVQTFHALARSILCAFPPPGYTADFMIMEPKQEWQLIRRLIKVHGLDIHPELVREKLTLARNTRDSSLLTPELEALYKSYMQELRRNNSMDFDALLTWCAWTLENNAQALRYYQDKYRYLLVDEFQDTSPIQYSLLKSLFTGNLLCVGDYDQSIYSFRGADVNLILNLPQDFPGLSTHYLQQNYRCTKKIVQAANALIVNNKKRQPKPHTTQRPEGQPIVRKSCLDPEKEAEYVVGQIAAIKEQGVQWQDFALLYRINLQSIPFIRALTAKGIPFRAVGDSDYFDLPEIKNILCFYHLVADANDTQARGDALAVLHSLRHPDPQATLTTVLAGLAGRQDLEQIYNVVLKSTGMGSELRRNTSQAGLKALENVNALEPIVAEYRRKGLKDFLEFSQTARSGQHQDAVNLLTIHKAKGLEFDTVFVCGLEDDMLPHYQSQSQHELEEERRMLYVALTRAKDRLFLTCSRQRKVKNKTLRLQPSRFLWELKLEDQAKTNPTGSIAIFSARPDYRAEAESSRKEHPQGPWRDSSGNRWGICKYCSQFTRDWWSFDGKTNSCECNDCKYK